MKKMFQTLQNELMKGHNAVLVTIVASSGSTPRGAGARMLMTEEGRLCGTIGGGAVEYKSEQIAQGVLAAQNSRMETFALHENDVLDLGMICGGDVTVYFHFISAADKAILQLTHAAQAIIEAGEQGWLITDITPGTAGALTVYGARTGLAGAPLPAEVVECLGARSQQICVGERVYHAEVFCRAGRVYIFGGGHVAQALVPALAAVDFRCVVLEDREDFCRPELFSGVEEIRLVAMDQIKTALSVTEDDYICIMTRGHKNDLFCEAYALTTPAHYIGVIGSRKKIATVNEKLMGMGFDEADISRVTTPIGLNIGGETPAEIAVSITAQLIQVRAAKEKQK